MTENQRERNLQRYYQPWLDARNLAGVETSTGSGDEDVNALTFKGYQPASSKDKALTAFAQLATLKLGVRRAMVSLIDSKHQYILAEATKTLSLFTDTTARQEDEIWLGNAILDRQAAVCHHTFGSKYTAADANGDTLSTEALVVPDMREDPRFAKLSYVQSKPGVLFYAGVPIKTGSGHNIGVYAVSSDETRHGLSVEELRFMMDLAATVMQHLEMSKAVDDRSKGERLVKGLTHFIEGAGALPETLPTEQYLSTMDEQSDTMTENNPNKTSPSPTATLARQTTNARIEDPDELQHVSAKARSRATSRATDSSVTGARKADTDEESVSNVFQRASRIIRDSTFADGVVFFGTAAGAQQQPPSYVPSAQSDLSEDTSDSGATGLGPRSKRGKSSSELIRSVDSIDPFGSQEHKLCELIGWSVDPSTALRKEDVGFSEASMTRYIKRYPHGKYFSFSEEGSRVSSDERSESDVSTAASGRVSEVHRQPSKKRKQRSALMPSEILKFLPGLRNLIFLPLWDAASERWIAGGFIWSNNIARLMSPRHELPFLKAFGNSIMSEVSRINAQQADRAKSTFIASVSHELRSPLHGILGSVEFLQETEITQYQQGLLNSVEACGRTLLDTIDHVLDYAKINKLRGNGSRRHRQMTTVLSNSILGADAEFDLSELVEEVVEAVAAGHTFRKSHAGEVTDKTRSSHNSALDPTQGPTSAGGSDNVHLILDVFPHTGWTVRSQPGALRRIVMNLLGNALKYTPSGFVAISLQAKKGPENSPDLGLTFRFTDSGKGMSQEFQRTRLFAPFSQEDPFTAGTGLGLSIVRQIVESLNGTISLKSTKGVGTEVEVNLSLPVVPDARTLVSKTIKPVAQGTKDLEVGMLASPPVGASSEKLVASLHNTCENWFDMRMTQVQRLDSSKDLFVLVECGTPIDTMISEYVSNGSVAPVVVIAHDTAREIVLKRMISQSSHASESLIEVISQPCGPFKLCEVYNKVQTFLQGAKDKPTMLRAASTPAASAPKGRLAVMPKLPVRSSSEQSQLGEIRTSGTASPLVGNLASATATPRAGSPPLAENLPPLPTPSSATSDALPHVLLVDDNPINLHLLVMFMKKCAYPYTSASNGLEALQAYQSASGSTTAPHTSGARSEGSFLGHITHILMDISMPVMDGLESTRQIRAFERANKLAPAKIIALTGLASQQAQDEASASGVDAYLAKPVKFRELKKVLDEGA